MNNTPKAGRFQNLRAIRNADEMPLDAPESLGSHVEATSPASLGDQTGTAPRQDVPTIPSGAQFTDRTTRSPRKQARATLVEEERAGGKRSNPAFMQISAFVERAVHLDAGDKLRAENRAKPRENWRDLSDVINALLAGWLAERYTV